ncbi:RES family NAD+ phosphorylase [uncultured Nocardioides sp.]|uniref:RES family NAD+ phosphorylase n=1 Tax=uncultured Nocardioides sp. TaxID=198441 RepID=UPI0026274FC2|nr:RES family NAD+ phosphorylase [uncultured Nocardioides sp.]
MEYSTTGDRGCWWFSSAGTPAAKSGRFDLPLPRGTCYLSIDEEGAARERVGTQIVKRAGRESVLASVLTADPGRRVIVSAVQVPRTRTANVSVRPAQRWVNRSLWSGTGIYAITQAWAAKFDEAGFGGVRYPPRFTLGPGAMALALFGPAKQPIPSWSIDSSRTLEQVLTDTGVRIVSPPRSAPDVLASDTAPPPL